MYLQFKSEHISTGKNNIKTKGEDCFQYVLKYKTNEEREAYLASIEEKFRLIDETTNEVLVNRQDYIGERVELVKTFNGKFVPSRGKLAKARSLAKSNPFMRDALAQMMIQDIFGNSSSSVSTPVVEKEEVTEEDENLPS